MNGLKNKLEVVQANLASVNVEGWLVAILGDDLDALTQAEFERPRVHLLPYFDSFLLGHKEREHLVALEHRSKVYRPQGWIAPVGLVDGLVAGVWEYAREKNRLQVKVTKFGSISRDVMAGIHEEAQDLGRFLETPSVDFQIH